jgi:integrase
MAVADSWSASSSSRPCRRPPEVLSEPEAIAFIKACSTRAPTGIRNRALIAVAWRSGLRISEALALELRDLDLEAGTLRVRHGKGDKSRTVGVDEQTAALLARWLDRRRRLSPGARAPVFCTLAGERSVTPASRSPTATYVMSPRCTSSKPCAPDAGTRRDGGCLSSVPWTPEGDRGTCRNPAT